MSSSDTFKNLEHQKEFELWAFGHSPVSYEISLMHTWNSRHGDKYYALPDESVDASVRRMVEVYENSLNYLSKRGETAKQHINALMKTYRSKVSGQKDASSNYPDEKCPEICACRQGRAGDQEAKERRKQERKARKDRQRGTGSNDREVQSQAKKGEEVMDLLGTYAKYVEKDNQAERAAFEAAMVDRLKTDGYKMADLIYELFVCQKRVAILQGEFEAMKNVMRSLQEGYDHDEDEDDDE